MVKKLFFPLFLLALLVLISCKKEVKGLPDFSSGTIKQHPMYGKPFTLAHPKDIHYVGLDSLPWVNRDNFSRDFGILCNYGRNGKKISMENYIQVAYFSKKMQGCSTADSLYIWLDNTQKSSPKSRYLTPRYKLENRVSKPADCREMFLGQRAAMGSTVDGKYMAYAYIEHDENYWVGMNLTTADSFDFYWMLPHFKYLVQSYNQ